VPIMDILPDLAGWNAGSIPAIGIRDHSDTEKSTNINLVKNFTGKNGKTLSGEFSK